LRREIGISRRASPGGWNSGSVTFHRLALHLGQRRDTARPSPAARGGCTSNNRKEPLALWCPPNVARSTRSRLVLSLGLTVPHHWHPWHDWCRHFSRVKAAALFLCGEFDFPRIAAAPEGAVMLRFNGHRIINAPPRLPRLAEYSRPNQPLLVRRPPRRPRLDARRRKPYRITLVDADVSLYARM